MEHTTVQDHSRAGHDIEGFIRSAINSFENQVEAVVPDTSQWYKIASGWILPGSRTVWYVFLYEGRSLGIYLKQDLTTIDEEIEIREIGDDSPEYAEIMEAMGSKRPKWQDPSMFGTNPDQPWMGSSYSRKREGRNHATVQFNLERAAEDYFTPENGVNVGIQMANEALENFVIVQKVEKAETTLSELQKEYPAEAGRLRELEETITDLSDRFTEAEAKLDEFHGVEEYRQAAWVKSKLELMEQQLNEVTTQQKDLKEFVQFAKDSLQAIRSDAQQQEVSKWTKRGVWAAIILGIGNLAFLLYRHLWWAPPTE